MDRGSSFTIIMWRNRLTVSGTAENGFSFTHNTSISSNHNYFEWCHSAPMHAPLAHKEKATSTYFLSDFNTPLCSSMFSATCSSLNWLSGTCILESRWLSLTPHIITGSHSWLISSHKMILCCLSRKKCRLGEINKWWSNSNQSYPHPLVSFWD